MDIETAYVLEHANMWAVLANLKEFHDSFPVPQGCGGDDQIDWSTIASMKRINELLGEAMSHADSIGK